MKFFEPGGVRVKICGLTNPADAKLAIAAGADALGFNFFPGSKRYIVPSESLEWIKAIEEPVAKIAVVVNPDVPLLDTLREAECFDGVQFHGDENPEFCSSSGFQRWIRAVRVKDSDSYGEALAFPTPLLLLDAWSADAYGGTGLRLDWDLARDFAIVNTDRCVILAGGLTPTNVRSAVRIVRPHAVDVAGGVEREPRRKDDYLMREFVSQARSA